MPSQQELDEAIATLDEFSAKGLRIGIADGEYLTVLYPSDRPDLDTVAKEAVERLADLGAAVVVAMVMGSEADQMFERGAEA